MTMSNKLQKIPKAIIEMAEFIKECDENGDRFVIVRRRNWGKTAALLLARQTTDIPHEEVKNKQIENGLSD